ncbi:hypothetical protein DEAOPOFO_00250 [Klebsiella phage 066058]|nr:hypothetical protein DEAOPOFO_00250 [Klebsiella phage 066058]
MVVQVVTAAIAWFQLIQNHRIAASVTRYVIDVRYPYPTLVHPAESHVGGP